MVVLTIAVLIVAIIASVVDRLCGGSGNCRIYFKYPVNAARGAGPAPPPYNGPNNGPSNGPNNGPNSGPNNGPNNGPGDGPGDGPGKAPDAKDMV